MNRSTSRQLFKNVPNSTFVAVLEIGKIVSCLLQLNENFDLFVEGKLGQFLAAILLGAKDGLNLPCMLICHRSVS